MPDLVGHPLGQYRIVEQIGLGGMATVFKAYQPALDRYVAIKVLPAYYAHEPGFAERFTREAKAVAKLTHPHVLPIFDFGQEDGLSYIVMQYVDAGTLKDMLGQPISLVSTADIIEQIADALDYAHDQGIVHRDVKPSNVLMDRGRWVLLSDFGLAKMVEGSVQLTDSGVGVGTPAYMAPEQGQGLKVDRRADIYSLGIILYEMVTGRVPFEAETPMALVVKHITEPLPLPRKINPALPESVERIIMKALAKNPDDRYETAGKLAAALRKAVAGLDTALVDTGVEPVEAVVHTGEARTILEEGGATQVVPPSVAPVAQRRKGVPVWAVIALVALLLVLALSFLGIIRRIRVEQARQTARATQTAAAQAAAIQTSAVVGPAATPTAPLAPTPHPKETPSPGPTESPIEKARRFIERNPPVFQDDFQNPGSGWETADDQHGQRGYQNGAYTIRVPEIVGQENIASVRLPLDRLAANFVLQLDLVSLEGGPGSRWSISFREQPDHSHVYAGLGKVPPEFGIGEFAPGKEALLARGAAPRYRPQDTMRLTLVVAGPQLELFLDDQPVGQARTDLMQPGKIHFNVVNRGDPLVAYRIDNVALWIMEDKASALPPVPGLPLSKDWEDGQADGWRLEPGWQVVQEDDGNHALLGEKHRNAVIESDRLGDVVLRFRAKPLNGDLLVNFRADPKNIDRTRYVAHFVPETVVLHKFQSGLERQVVHSPIAYTPGQWHPVELSVRGGHIEIRLDGQLVLVYDDPDPLPAGLVFFENGDPPARQLIDDVLIEPVMR